MTSYHVTLTDQERSQLEAIKSKGSHRSRKILNALILLNCDEGDHQPNRSTNEQVCSILGISDRKINRVKKRFVEEGLHVALHGRRGDHMLANRVVELGYVDKISHETVRQILKNELKPWKQKGWIIPPDLKSEFVAPMEQVLDVYKCP